MSTSRNAAGRRRGMVLIIVLSVLAVMAILGISLLTLNALDRTVTDNHLHQVQARLTARSGVEDAMARLRDGAVLMRAFDLENDWMYRGNDVSGQEPSKRAEPLIWAQRPSFQKKALNGLPETVELWRDDLQSTAVVGVSGTGGGRFHDRSNVYSLQVRDLSSCIYMATRQARDFYPSTMNCQRRSNWDVPNFPARGRQANFQPSLPAFYRF